MKNIFSKILIFSIFVTALEIQSLPFQNSYRKISDSLKNTIISFKQHPLKNSLKIGTATLGAGIVIYSYPFIKKIIILFKTLPFDTVPFIKRCINQFPHFIRTQYINHSLDELVKPQIEQPLTIFTEEFQSAFDPSGVNL